MNPRFAELTDEEMRRFWLGLADRDRVAYMKAKAERQAAKLGAEDGLERRTTTTRRPSTTTTTTTTTSAPDPEEEPFDAREEWPECADVISKIQVFECKMPKTHFHWCCGPEMSGPEMSNFGTGMSDFGPEMSVSEVSDFMPEMS